MTGRQGREQRVQVPFHVPDPEHDPPVVGQSRQVGIHKLEDEADPASAAALVRKSVEELEDVWVSPEFSKELDLPQGGDGHALAGVGDADLFDGDEAAGLEK